MGAQAWGAEPLLAGATMEMASHRIEVLIHSCTYFLMKLHASHQAPPPLMIPSCTPICLSKVPMHSFMHPILHAVP